MRILYQIGIYGYGLILRLASLFSPKAKLWVSGRKNWRQNLKKSLENKGQKPLLWFHCASVGEFEQGRPVIETIKSMHPDVFVLLSFYSPSGYELRKNYNKADLVCYLPLDTKKNAKDWVKIINPTMAIIVKYEFWPNLLLSLHKSQIPTIFFSSIFRESQHFFSWYGGWYRKVLASAAHIFVQNEQSVHLLNKIHIKQHSIVNDTRFDRVISIAENLKPIAFIEEFLKQKVTIVAGSTWPEDEKLLSELYATHPSEMQLIIAPHEITPQRINQVEKIFHKNVLKYSQATIEKLKEANVLIIDNIGMLSSLYQYADISFVGGGFGKGIHNTLEAAVHGCPILFGPNYHKFKEALDLISIQGAFTVSNSKDLNKHYSQLADSKNRTKASELAKNYVYQNKGGTESVVAYITKNLSHELKR